MMRKKRYGYDLSVMADLKRAGVHVRGSCWLPIKGSVDHEIHHFAKHLFKPNGICRRCGKPRQPKGTTQSKKVTS